MQASFQSHVFQWKLAQKQMQELQPKSNIQFNQNLIFINLSLTPHRTVKIITKYSYTT